MTESQRTTNPEVIRSCASRIVQSGALGRGHVYPKLLTYLAERAIRGDVPKEFDISVDVFGKNKPGVDSPDAQTRVHVHKLRSRLDAYYAGSGKEDPFRLEIPKGTYHLFAIANERGPVPAARTLERRPWAPYVVAGLLVSLIVSLGINVVLFDRADRQELSVLRSPVWAGFQATARPILIVVGDHFFFGEAGTRVRIRDIRINSKEDLRAAIEYGSNKELVFETLTYLPKSAVFALQTVLPHAVGSGKTVNLKLVSELTSEDLRDYDLIYIGFVRAMALLRDYYFTKSNFTAEPPLFMSLTRKSGEIFARSGPVPQHNRDYGLVARFAGPAGNAIVVLAGIGDVGVLAAVRALSTSAGIERVQALLDATNVDASGGFEVLVEADGHSRTDLDFRVIGAYALGPHNDAWPPPAAAPPAHDPPSEALGAPDR